MRLFFSIVSYLTLALGCWIALCSVINSIYLGRKKKRASAHVPGKAKVSVLIPARNEEESLPALLESMAAQDWDDYEVLVADDNSSDRTLEIIREFERKCPRIRGFHNDGTKRYSKHGKINALLSLMPHVTGDYILCTDADTIHSPSSIRTALSLMERDSLDILSGLPRQLCPDYPTGCITEAMVFSRSVVPLFFTDMVQDSRLAIGIGQFVMMKRESYEKCGGYRAMEDRLCDDLGIIRHFMKNGFRYGQRDLSSLLSCRMYSDARSAFHGLERSITDIIPLPAIPLILIVVSALVLVSLSPLSIVASLITGMGREALLAALGYILLSIGWYISSRALSFEKKEAASVTPVLLMICAMYLHGLYRRLTGKGFIWKGRKV